MLASKMITWGSRAMRPPPPIDRHPLARADGGYYPGKRFDPTDILTDPGNWIVWKRFLIFFFSLLLAPLGTFFLFDKIFSWIWDLHYLQSQTFAAMVAVCVLQGLMFFYAKIAAAENTEDYENAVSGTAAVAPPQAVAATAAAPQAPNPANAPADDSKVANTPVAGADKKIDAATTSQGDPKASEDTVPNIETTATKRL